MIPEGEHRVDQSTQNAELFNEVRTLLPGENSQLGFDQPSRIFEFLQGECLVRYGALTSEGGEKKIVWVNGLDNFKAGDFIRAGDGRVVVLINRSEQPVILRPFQAGPAPEQR